jgi:hypothetical protein
MSPVITLSDEAFTKLQALARPFVDTPESVISSLADAELQRRNTSPNGNGLRATGKDEFRRLNPDSPENLTHTRLLSATVDGRAIHRPKWNGVLDHLHVLGRQRMGSFEALRRASGANIREGRYEESGFRYLPEADLSIQGVDANVAWSHALGLARALQVPIELKLDWRHKDGAARPGETAVLQWTLPTP